MVVHVDAELSLAVSNLEVGSMDSDDISDSVDDWEVLELVADDDNLGILSLGVEGWVNNLEGADESVVLNLVWESSIDDDTVEVAWVGGGKWNLVEWKVIVLVGLLGWGSRLRWGRLSG